MNNQEKILIAYKNLLKTTPFEDLSIASICEEAKVSPSTFYHYYHNKTDLIVAMYQNIDDYFLNEVLPNCLKLTPYESIVRYLVYLAEFTNKIGLTFMKNIYKAQIDQGSDYFVMPDRGISKGLLILLERALRENILETDNLPKLLEQLLVIVRGVTYNWCITGGNFDIVKATHDIISNYLIAF